MRKRHPRPDTDWIFLVRIDQEPTPTFEASIFPKSLNSPAGYSHCGAVRLGLPAIRGRQSEKIELDPLQGVHWRNNKWLHETLDYATPQEVETEYSLAPAHQYRDVKEAELNPAHFNLKISEENKIYHYSTIRYCTVTILEVNGS